MRASSSNACSSTINQPSRIVAQVKLADASAAHRRPLCDWARQLLPVYVSPDLIAQLQLLARERRTGCRGFLFGSAKSGDGAMSSVHAWRIVTDCSRRSGVYGERADGVLRDANASSATALPSIKCNR